MSEIINAFPGYEYVKGEDGKYHNMYRGTDVGFGGYVYAEPGMYTNVALIDVASMHPTSIIAMNKLGEYTQRYADLRQARIYIKHRQFKEAGELFDGRLKKYLQNEDEADALSKVLKLPLNSFYGQCSAGFPNPARDIEDVNNIVALRGALFMRTLQDEVKSHGYNVAHIKTDSIKIPEATQSIIDFCIDFAKQYGYEFEHEATYQKMCLVNGSTYIAKYDEFGERGKNGKHANEWTATAAQFKVPYVFKKLFSHEPIEFEDLCEVKSVQTAIYLDMDEGKPEGEHDYRFIGKIGQFCPIKEGCGGGRLMRENNEGGYSYVTGTKGYRWLETETVKLMNKQNDIDESYYINQCDKAVQAISEYGDFDWFVSDDPVSKPIDIFTDELPF